MPVHQRDRAERPSFNLGGTGFTKVNASRDKKRDSMPSASNAMESTMNAIMAVALTANEFGPGRNKRRNVRPGAASSQLKR